MTETGMRTCRRCGKQCYRSRREARSWARRLHPGEHMSEYRCGRTWHIGHLPEPVIRGVMCRDELHVSRGTR